MFEKEELNEVKRQADYDGLKDWLINTHSFNEDRVDKMVKRLQKVSKAKQQTRLDSFFGPPKIISTAKISSIKPKAKQTRTSLKSKAK